MKALFITSVGGNGGSASTAYHNVRLLRNAGHDCALAAPGEYWPKRGASEGVPVHSFLELQRGFKPRSFYHDYKALRSYLRENQIEAVIVQKSPEQWLAHYALKNLGQPCALVRLRGVVFPIKPSYFNKALHNRMQAILCSCTAISEQYRQLPGFSMDHVHVLLEGIDTERFHPASPSEKTAARRKFGLPEDAFIVGTAGRPAPVKGHRVLLDAFRKARYELAAPARKVHLAVFSDESRRGPGSYETLKGHYPESEYEHVSIIPGFLDDMAEVYRALDIYALPSLGSEGSSRAGLEASASGLALLASKVGVLPDLVVPGETGVLLPPGEAEPLAQALKAAWDDPQRTRSMGNAARARMESDFREKDYAVKLAKLLQEAFKRASS